MGVREPFTCITLFILLPNGRCNLLLSCNTPIQNARQIRGQPDAEQAAGAMRGQTQRSFFTTDGYSSEYKRCNVVYFQGKRKSDYCHRCRPLAAVFTWSQRRNYYMLM